MARKKGRPNLYETIIKPAIESGRLEEMAKDPNLNKRKIAQLLGVSYSVFMQAQKDFPQISDIFQKAKVSQVEELEKAIKKEATGYWITEKKTTKRKDDSGKWVAVVEEYEKWCRPNATTQIFLITNLTHSEGYKGETVYHRDPSMIEMKKAEMELKKEIAELKEW
ncbi:MAG: hypothetical protein IKC11_03115 [Clostridia bacterium]|nr:hypothetical protein [Clostridia bacterium]